MLKMVDGTGIIGVDMICPLGISTPQPPNYDRVEMEGTGMLVLPNSLDAPLERLELGGKTEQVTTRGVNLFDASLAKNKENYKEVTIAGSVIYAIELSLKPNTKYAFQCVIKSVPTTMNVGNSTIRYVVSDGQKRVITTNEDGKLYIGFSGNPDGEIHKIGVSIVDIQVEESTTVTPYEPYTGGKPSPSPEHPQDIVNSGKWNEQKYEVDVKVTGKNLLNLQKEPDVKGVYLGWKVGSGGNVTLSLKDKGNNADVKGCFLGLSKKCDSAEGIIWILDNGVIKTNPLTKTHSYVSVFPANENTAKKLTERFEIQCEHGTVATPYQSYAEQTLTLTSDRPITKWDKLVEQDGQIGWLYKSKIIDGFDGQSSNITLGGKQGEVQHFSVVFTDVPNGNGNGDIYVDRYRAIAMSYTKAEFGICCNWNSGVKFFSAPNENVTTVQEFKTWLAENPLVLAYETTSTEFVPLPQSEQNAIRALKTYYPTTVITADGGELDPDIKVTYRKEI